MVKKEVRSPDSRLQFQKHPLFAIGDTAHKDSYLFCYQQQVAGIVSEVIKA